MDIPASQFVSFLEGFWVAWNNSTYSGGKKQWNLFIFGHLQRLYQFITSRDGPFWKWYCCVLNHANITRCKSFIWNADGTIEWSSLVGDFNPSEKYESNWKSSPNRSENTTYLKPPPRSALHTTTSYKCMAFQNTHVTHTNSASVEVKEPVTYTKPSLIQSWDHTVMCNLISDWNRFF